MPPIQRYTYDQLKETAMDMRSVEFMQARDVDRVLAKETARIDQLLKIVAQQDEELTRLRQLTADRQETTR